MSLQSDAAKTHLETLLDEAYPQQYPVFLFEKYTKWEKEYHFAPPRRWAFDYAVPAILCAIPGLYRSIEPNIYLSGGVIEIDGGTFQGIRTGHSSGVGLRNWREKNNTAMSLGWRVWHYAPEEVVKAGRKTLPDEPILKKLPWR